MKPKAISRKGKEFNVRQRTNEEVIPFGSANLNSIRLKKEGKANLENFSYVVPWQMGH